MATFTLQEIIDLGPCRPWNPCLICQCEYDPVNGQQMMDYVVACGYDLSILNFVVGSNLAMAEELIDVAGLGVDLPDVNRFTSLHYAVFKRQANVITYLLGKGAEKNLPDVNGITPKTHAILTQDAAIMEAMGV